VRVVVLDSVSVVSLYCISHTGRNLKFSSGVELKKGKHGLLFEHANAEFGVIKEGLVA
jgi:hypothetical protein